MMNKKVFITGANGMLGASITREVLAQGYQVKAQILPNTSRIVLTDLPIEFVTVNV